MTLDLHTQGFLDALARIDKRKKKEMTYQLFIGNNLEILPTLPDNSIDSIVTDPPYGLSDNKYVADTIARWIAGERDFVPDGKGFMGKAWDAFVPPPALWDECLRVLKPGGHLLAFFGSRTQDIGALAIRLAGFEIRDSIAWLYGSGFPKSMNISKAVDDHKQKSIGLTQQEQRFCAWMQTFSGLTESQSKELLGSARFLTGQIEIVNTATKENPRMGRRAMVPTFAAWEKIKPILATTPPAWVEELVKDPPKPGIEHPGDWNAGKGEGSSGTNEWAGWGTALKPALEPIVVARKPMEGTVANNVLKWGTGGLNIDGSRIGTRDKDESGWAKTGSKASDNVALGKQYDREPISEVGLGRWPANIILSHTELCNPTGQTLKNKTSAGKRTATFGTQDTQSGGDGSGGWSGYEYETEVYECVEGCPVKLLDEQSGTSKSTGGTNAITSKRAIYGESKDWEPFNYGDRGGASRFFYVAKASKRDRNEGLDELEEKLKPYGNRDEVPEEGDKPGSVNDKFTTQPAKNFHPTVKPTALMEYLVKLVTPPNGTVLDPFTGSGSTGKAAILQGFNFIGIEMTEEYVPIIEGRLKHAEVKVAKAKENIEAQPQGLF